MLVICGQLPQFHVFIALLVNHVDSPQYARAGVLEPHFKYHNATNQGVIAAVAGLSRTQSRRSRVERRPGLALAGSCRAGLARDGISQVSPDAASSIKHNTCHSRVTLTAPSFFPFRSHLPAALPLEPVGDLGTRAFEKKVSGETSSVWSL